MTRYYFLVLARRSAICWLLVRIVATILAYAIRSGAILPITGVFVVGLTVMLILIDMRISGEEILLANFGVGRARVIAASSVMIAILESIAQIVL